MRSILEIGSGLLWALLIIVIAKLVLAHFHPELVTWCHANYDGVDLFHIRTKCFWMFLPPTIGI